jgi:hypothetical protein
MKNMLGCIAAVLFFTCRIVSANAEDCPVQGDAFQWAADFCMYKSGTDDFAHPDVVACMQKQAEPAPRKVCETKRKYKQEICAIVVRGGYYSRVDDCLNDRSFSGPTVRSGGI